MGHLDSDFNWKIAYERLVGKMTEHLDLLEEAVLSGEIPCTTLYKIIKKLLRDEQTRISSQLRSQSQPLSAQNATIFKALFFNGEETLNKNANVQENLNAVSAPDIEIEMIDLENVNVENLDLDVDKLENANSAETQREEENCIESTHNLEIDQADAETDSNDKSTDRQADANSDAILEQNQNQDQQADEKEQEEKESPMETRLSKKLFKCPMCPYKTKWAINIQTHLKHEHFRQPTTGSGSSESRPFPCPHSGCNYAAKLKINYERHMTTHSGEKSFFCSHPNCNFSTSRKDHLIRHTLRRHTRETPYVCQFESCSFATATSYQLLDHSRKHTGEKPYKCSEPNCERSFRSSAAFLYHRQSHLRNPKPKKVVAESKRKVLQNVKEHSSFQCPLCEYLAKTKQMLSTHMETHSLEKPFACPVESCQFRCKSKSNLFQHSKTHSDEKQYKCEVCPHRGKTRGSVQIHMKNMHSDPKSWTFKCKEPKCDFASRTKKSLERHLLTHSDKKKYACSFPGCDYLSLVKQYVNRHEMLIHSEEKKEKCRICLYRCKTKSTLVSHMRTHTKEEPYKCNEEGCEYRAKQANALKHHQKKHHRQTSSSEENMKAAATA